MRQRRNVVPPCHYSRFEPRCGEGRLMNARMLLSGLIALAAALTAASPAAAQETYPSKPVTMIVPFPPGGVADIVGRPLADAMGRALGGPVVIENKSGA